MALVVKNPSAITVDEGDVGSIPGLGRSPGGRHGNPLQYSCLEYPMDRGAWRALVHRVEKSWTMTETTQHASIIIISKEKGAAEDEIASLTQWT